MELTEANPPVKSDLTQRRDDATQSKNRYENHSKMFNQDAEIMTRKTAD